MINGSPAKIALYYPAFLGGGAEAVALWMLEALQRRYSLTLFTLSPVNFDRLNQLYGTQLSSEWVEVKPLLPASLSPIVSQLVANSQPVRMLLFHGLIRYLKSEARHYQVLMSGYNAIDFGKPGIQYVHWIKVLDGNPVYEKISDFSLDRVRQNLSLVNSQTVAEHVKNHYGTSSTVMYPPVVLDAFNQDCQQKAWQQKELAFICSGRLTVAKQPHKAIQILKQVRDRGFPVSLHLTGGGGGTYAWGYERFLKKLIRDNADWVTLHENLSYADYVAVLSRCRYGIHYKKEPFGISIAEMVKAGAIPFVRSQGGQVEIVGADRQELLFDSDAEAVEKIVAVLSNPELQTQLRSALVQQQQLFSTQRFTEELRQVVADYLTADHLTQNDPQL